jgi:hypothetical protein
MQHTIQLFPRLEEHIQQIKRLYDEVTRAVGQDDGVGRSDQQIITDTRNALDALNVVDGLQLQLGARVARA